MEPELIVLEECNRFFIVEQRWGYDRGAYGISDSAGIPSNPHDMQEYFPTAYIFLPMNGPYTRVYREWVNRDNRLHRANTMQFGYIVEARTRRQVVDAMVARGHAAMFNSKFVYPQPITAPIIGFVGTQRVRANPDGTVSPVRVSRQATYTFEKSSPIYPDRSNTMNKAEILRRAQQAAIEKVAELESEINRLDALPKEPVAKDGEPLVVYFERTFRDGGPLYTYAAVKAGNRWYVTGAAGNSSFNSWAALVDWIDQATWPVLRQATKFKSLS